MLLLGYPVVVPSEKDIFKLTMNFNFFITQKKFDEYNFF